MTHPDPSPCVEHVDSDMDSDMALPPLEDRAVVNGAASVSALRASVPSAGEIQDVYDLIISTCQYDPKTHARGAAALRVVNALAKAAGGEA